MDIQKLLDSMTLEEKLGQMLQVHTRNFVGSNSELTGPDTQLGIDKTTMRKCGSVLSFSSAEEMQEAQKVSFSINEKKIPMMFMHNVIYGYKTVHPIPLGMGATFNPDLMEECSVMAAKESKAAGVSVTFAPMLDLVRDARWGRVMESTGEDPYLNSVMARSFVRGYKQEGVATCIKHFAAYGAAEAGRDYNGADISEHTLREYYMPAYKAAIDEGSELVMTSFNTVGGVPASGSPWLLNDILRDEFKFDGVVISDYNAIRELISHGICEDEKAAAEVAINCNIDIEMMSATYFKNVKELLAEGKITMEQIDKMVLRILRLKEQLGLFEDPYFGTLNNNREELFLCEKHREIARRACQEACVLLKNDGTLPLNKNEKVALVGPFGDTGETIGHWRGTGKSTDTVTLLSGMRAHTQSDNIYFAKGASFLMDDTDESGFQEARAQMQKAQTVVLAIGEHQMFSGEGKSKGKIIVPPLHIKLCKIAKELGKKVVAVVYCGRPLELVELTEVCDSILVVWQPGTEGGNAIANLLYGTANPSGKLTMSFPYSVSQLPIYYNHLPTGRPKAKGDKLPDHPLKMPFTSMYMDTKNEPLYPFGYGLSYTNFEISEPALSSETITKDGKITATVTVKNTGSVSGSEVVQMYIRDNFASISRPVMELKGFEKVTLNAGEEKTIEFEIKEEMLKFHNFKNEFISEKGDFTLFIGNSSNNTKNVLFKLV